MGGDGARDILILDMLRKAYAMVDDPSTDSIISWSEDGKSFVVWNPTACCRDLLPRLLGITDFTLFETVPYGFKRSASSPHMEFARDGFVRGQPELLKYNEREQREGFEKSLLKDVETLLLRISTERERRVQADLNVIDNSII